MLTEVRETESNQSEACSPQRDFERLIEHDEQEEEDKSEIINSWLDDMHKQPQQNQIRSKWNRRKTRKDLMEAADPSMKREFIRQKYKLNNPS